MIPNSTLTINLDDRTAEWSGDLYFGGTCTVTVTSASNIGSIPMRIGVYKSKFGDTETLVAGIASFAMSTYSGVATLNLNTEEVEDAFDGYINGQQASFLFKVFRYDEQAQPYRYLFRKYLPITYWESAVDDAGTTTPVVDPVASFGNRRVYLGDTYVYNSEDGLWYKEIVVGADSSTRYELVGPGISLP